MAKVSNEYLPLSVLGSFPDDWQETTLAQVCRQVTDGTHDSPKPVLVGGYPLITGKAIKDRRIDFAVAYNISDDEHQKVIDRSKPERDDILFANIGNSIGDLVRVQTDRSFSIKNVALFKPDVGKVYPRFLEYFFLSEQVQSFIKGSTRGSAQPFIGLSSLRGFPVALPPMDEQRNIGNILGALDDRITVLRETNATLEAIAQALFKSWFVDFDPVHAKQEGRAPEGMDEATAALFPDGFEESVSGLVPRGWRVAPVGEVVDTVGGGTPDTKDSSYWEPAEHCWTTPKDLSGILAPVLLDTERKLSSKGIAKISSGLLPAGTLLMSSRAPIGYLAISQVPMAINQGYIAMPPGSALPPIYMLYWCRQNMETIKSHANGSTFMEISKRAFRPLLALVPTADIVEQFVAAAGTLFERLVENEKQAQTLATLRDTLLPRLISGQLRLPEAEAVVAAAA